MGAYRPRNGKVRRIFSISDLEPTDNWRFVAAVSDACMGHHPAERELYVVGRNSRFVSPNTANRPSRSMSAVIRLVAVSRVDVMPWVIQLCPSSRLSPKVL